MSHSLVVSRVAAASPACRASPVSLAGLVEPGAVRWDSTKRKRAKKMNKHKYQKMKKRLRNLQAKNVKGG